MELKLSWPCPGSIGAGLLIVPYGIETESVRVGKQMYQSFNRTLWN